MAGLNSSSDDGGGRHAASGYLAFRRKRARRSIGEINVTPLVDVVLVLLLVFMVTAPMMSQGIDITLPTANQFGNQPEDPLTVTLDPEGRASLGRQPLAPPLPQDQIRALTAGRPTHGA